MNPPSHDQDDPRQTNLTSASRRMREGSSVAGSAIVTKDPEYIPLHELAKGWKAAISWATDPHTRDEARKKNDRGNLPLHSAASFRAPVEVIGKCNRLRPYGISVSPMVVNQRIHTCLFRSNRGTARSLPRSRVHDQQLRKPSPTFYSMEERSP